MPRPGRPTSDALARFEALVTSGSPVSKAVMHRAARHVDREPLRTAPGVAPVPTDIYERMHHAWMFSLDHLARLFLFLHLDRASACCDDWLMIIDRRHDWCPSCRGEQGGAS
jgi:hypothetical protein